MSSVCTASIRQKFVHTNTYTFVDCIVNLQVYGLTVDVANTEPPFLALSVAGISALTAYFGVTHKLGLASSSSHSSSQTLLVSGASGACGLVAGQVLTHYNT